MAFDSAVTSHAPDHPVFEARLTPHRSLSPLGFRVVMALIVAGCAVQAVPLTLLGAWPVGWFFGLDVLALYICFRISFARTARAEEVLLMPSKLLIRKLGWRGDVRERVFNPFWVRLRTIEDEDYGVQRVLLEQRSEQVEIGAFLAPFEKADFARAFQSALTRLRA